MKTIEEFQKEVSKWAAKTFPNQTSQSKAKHLLEEAYELNQNPLDTEEMADVFILVVNMAELAGVNIMEAAEKKMEKNRKRKWSIPDEHGVCHHIKEMEKEME